MLRSRAVTALCLLFCSVSCSRSDRTREAPAPPPPPPADTGFQSPESVLYDAVADVYLVSNVNGPPLAKDDNGFIARLSPGGEVLTLKWIDGATARVTLNAPKGLALNGDTLFVADIDVVRMYHRVTGASLGAFPIPGATFLNDVAVGPDGTLYVTDSGFRTGAGGLEPSGTDAVYRIGPDRRPVALASGDLLGHPNGILADSGGLVVATVGTGVVYRMNWAGWRTNLPAPPRGGLDGIVRSNDGSLLVSSWEGRAVYRYGALRGWTVAVDGVEAPADIGWDAARGQVLIPHFTANRVRAYPVK